jgi:hypothetical protein
MKPAVVLAIAGMLASPGALGATLEVVVVEHGAGPVMNQPVLVYPVTPEHPIDPNSPFLPRPAGRCTTGASGRCVIADLLPGIYAPEVRPLVDPNLSAATGSPVDAFGTVTLRAADSKATVRIELQRGVRLQFRVVIPNGGVPSGTRVELTGEDEENAQVRVESTGTARITLAAGRWVAHLVGPLPATIVAVELDAAALESADVPIDVSPPSSDRFVTWTLNKPCQVYGYVTSNRGETGVSVGAVLVSPGPWATSSFCRGTDCVGTPHGSVGPTGRYSFDLPCGSWRIAPYGDSLIESTPPFVPVALQDGEGTEVDFKVLETEPDAGTKADLTVRVLGPDEKPVANAPVELWPPERNTVRETPIETQSTGRFAVAARFSGLAAGSYLLRVRVPGCRIAVERAVDLDPEARAARHVTIHLSRGATIDALVKDENDHPAIGVALDVTSVGAVPESADPVARLAAQAPEISVPPSKDQTGHVIVSGLSAGSYRVRPALSGELASSATVVIGRKGERGEEETTVALEDDGRADLDVRVLPAASLAGRLVCADGNPLPREADACVLRLPSPDEDEDARGLCRDAVLPVRMIPLTGGERNEFHVGPLAPGSYRLGVRPRGYSSWTWALGTPDGSQAALVQVEGASKVDLGTVKALCGPAVVIRPSVSSGDPLPDLTIARVVASLSRRSKDGTVETRRLAVERDPDRVVLRELPEGEWTLEVSISHAFFAPPAPIHVVTDVRLARGELVKASAEIASVGGAVVVSAVAASARLTGGEIDQRIASAADGRITFEGVPPGTYEVDACGDPACSGVVKQWSQVTVVRGRLTDLAGSPQDPGPHNPPQSSPSIDVVPAPNPPEHSGVRARTR